MSQERPIVGVLGIQGDIERIRPGMTAEVFGRAPAVEGAEGPIIIPALAVAAGDAGTSHVWVVDQDALTVHRRDVTTGDLVGTDQIQIVDGLAGGEMIAISAVSRLREGMPIRKMDE